MTKSVIKASIDETMEHIHVLMLVNPNEKEALQKFNISCRAMLSCLDYTDTESVGMTLEALRNYIRSKLMEGHENKGYNELILNGVEKNLDFYKRNLGY